MSSASGWTVEETALLIDVYQGEEVLYNVKAKEYHNKFARQNALEKIVNILLVIKPDVTVAQVKAKINSLRSRYTTELSKIRCANHSGMGAEESYKVTFEFFENLKFLCSHVQARKGNLNMPIPSTSAAEVQSFSQETSADLELSENWTEAIEMTEENDDEKLKNLQRSTMSSPALSPAPTESSRKRRKTNDSSERSTMSSPALSPAPTESSRKRRKTNDSSEKFFQSAEATLQKLCSSNTPPPTDEWHDFAVFVRNSVKKLKTEELQTKCKHNILYAIIECEKENV